jgi:hypothetical protein
MLFLTVFWTIMESKIINKFEKTYIHLLVKSRPAGNWDFLPKFALQSRVPCQRQLLCCSPSTTLPERKLEHLIFNFPTSRAASSAHHLHPLVCAVMLSAGRGIMSCEIARTSGSGFILNVYFVAILRPLKCAENILPTRLALITCKWFEIKHNIRLTVILEKHNVNWKIG